MCGIICTVVINMQNIPELLNFHFGYRFGTYTIKERSLDGYRIYDLNATVINCPDELSKDVVKLRFYFLEDGLLGVDGVIYPLPIGDDSSKYFNWSSPDGWTLPVCTISFDMGNLEIAYYSKDMVADILIALVGSIDTLNPLFGRKVKKLNDDSFEPDSTASFDLSDSSVGEILGTISTKIAEGSATCRNSIESYNKYIRPLSA